MKLVLRILALSVVFAGAAASISSTAAKSMPSQQSATAHWPIPLCGPGLPTCPGVTSNR